MEITLSVNKEKVYDEVAKTTSYVGHKISDDDTAYNRIFTTDADKLLLDRFWEETCSASTEQLKRFIIDVSEHHSEGLGAGDIYSVDLNVAAKFDSLMVDSIKTSLFSFFVASIISSWFRFTNREEVETYSLDATGHMEDVMRKLYHRKRPVRPATNNDTI